MKKSMPSYDEKGIAEERICGELVRFDKRAEEGFSYLRNLHSEESEVFFYYAKNHHETRFRDGSNRRYSLKRESGGKFILIAS